MGYKMSFFQILTVISLNESFLYIYKQEIFFFEKKMFFDSFTPFFVPKMTFFAKKSHILLISWFLIQFNFQNKCKMNIL